MLCLPMELATLLTINLAVSFSILAVFVAVLTVTFLILRKNLHNSHQQARIFDEQLSFSKVHLNTAKTSVKSSSTNSSSTAAFIPINLNNPSKSGYLSRSFASRTALDQKIFARGLKDVF